MKISDEFEKVLLKPEWFLGVKSVIRLHSYMQGYMAALRDTGHDFDNREFESFCKWVEARFGLEITQSWAAIIFFMSGHDEARSIELTKELWIQFKRGELS